MKIGIIQASSQKEKNAVMEACVREAVPQEYEVINFGVFGGMDAEISYVQAAVCISLLLESRSVDFIVTGCSSGQGMMLACNSLPGVLCGYVEHVTDAFLFGRINDGNAVSYPLGMGWGWSGEINFRETMRALFKGPMGSGYPPRDAERKRRDARQLKDINGLCKRPLEDVLPLLDEENLRAVLGYEPVCRYVRNHGTDERLLEVPVALSTNLKQMPETYTT